MSIAKPHYVTIDGSQTRVWRAGSGPGLVALPGLAMAASVVARRMAALCPDWSVTVLELPGIGGSQPPAASPYEQAVRIAATVKALGLTGAVLVALDLSVPLASAIAPLAHAKAVILVGDTAARGFATQRPSLPSLQPCADGSHLARLHAHLRDLDIIDPSDPKRPAKAGAAYLTPDELHETFVAAAVDPAAYGKLWDQSAAAINSGTSHERGVLRCANLADLPQALAGITPPSPAPSVPQARPAARGIWCDYVDTPNGRVHLRRAGAPGARPPLLIFQSAPGSSAPLFAVIEGLAKDREVIAPDYLGNGDSDKPDRTVDIACLARDALDLADALGLARVDLWGTHTGALVALETALLAPDRVVRVVLEAPPLLAADFSEDILANYLPPITPDRWGLHVLQAWNMRRDMFLFWPWYRQERAAVRPLGLPDVATLHDWTNGLLKSGRTYHQSYRAAFEYDTRARLPLLTRPAFICAGPSDMLADGMDLARRIAPAGTVVAPTPATVWYPNQGADAVTATIAAYQDFLKG